MNIQQAKSIPLDTILSQWGHEPTKTKGHEIWYFSPLREEKTPSFHVDTRNQVWFDFGEGKGGTIIDLIMAWLEARGRPSSISDALKWLDGLPNLPKPDFNKPTTRSTKQPKTYRFLEDMPLAHPKLFEYLQSRAIDLDIASLYLREARLWHRQKEKEYHGLSFANDKGGLEFRNPFMKSSFGKKAITTIQGETNDSLHLFEGFMDFLSVLTIYELEKPNSKVIVLNSLSLHSGLLTSLEEFKGTIYSWYDNDDAGRSATQQLLSWSGSRDDIQIKPMNDSYEGFKDVNEWIMSYAKSKKN